MPTSTLYINPDYSQPIVDAYNVGLKQNGDVYNVAVQHNLEPHSNLARRPTVTTPPTSTYRERTTTRHSSLASKKKLSAYDPRRGTTPANEVSLIYSVKLFSNKSKYLLMVWWGGFMSCALMSHIPMSRVINVAHNIYDVCHDIKQCDKCHKCYALH